MSSVGSTGIQFEISLLAGRVKLSLLAGRVKLPLRGEGLGGVCCPLLMGPEPRYGLGLIGGGATFAGLGEDDRISARVS